MALRMGMLLVLTVILGGMIFALPSRPAQSDGAPPAVGIRLSTEIPGWALAVACISFAGAWAVVIFRIKTFGSYHKDHYGHSGDEEKHWTKRERDGLDDRVCEIQADVKTLLQRKE